MRIFVPRGGSGFAAGRTVKFNSGRNGKMKRHVGLIVLAVVALVLLAAGTVAFTVPSTDLVLVKTFGKTTRVLDGREDRDAGLGAKWIYPVEKLVRYDGRIDVFESANKELVTFDKQNILVTMYCAWRIKDPLKFQTAIKSIKAARRQIRDRLLSKQGDVIPDHPMRDFVNTDPGQMKLVQIEAEILALLKKEMEDEYGVEIVIVGLKSLGLVEGASEAVIDAMKKERRNEVVRYQSLGRAQSEAIKARAERARAQIIAFAERKADEIRTAGYREAASYYGRFEGNPELGMFLRYLDTLREGLRENATIWLDGTKIPAVKFFREGPFLPRSLRAPDETKKRSASGK